MTRHTFFHQDGSWRIQATAEVHHRTVWITLSQNHHPKSKALQLSALQFHLYLLDRLPTNVPWHILFPNRSDWETLPPIPQFNPAFE